MRIANFTATMLAAIVWVAVNAEEPRTSLRELGTLLHPLQVLKNVQVSCSAQEFEYNKRTKTFDKLTASAQITELLDARAASRVAITYNPLKSTWDRGKEPFFTENKTVVFNGTQWITAIDTQGPESSIYPYHRAEIAATSPYPDVRWETGETFWLSHLLVFNRIPLFDVMTGKVPLVIAISNQTVQDDQLLQITISDRDVKPSQRETLVLSKKHHWALVHRTTEIGLIANPDLPTIKLESTISAFKEVAPGLEFPTAAERIVFNKGNPTFRVAWSASNIETNVKETDESFQVHLAPGWRVEDKRYGTVFVVGQTPNAVIDNLKKEIKENSK